MPEIKLDTDRSVTQRPQYNTGQRLYAKSAGGKPGLEEDMYLFPASILKAFKAFARAPGGSNLYIGLEVTSTATEIQASSGYIVSDSEIYHIEPLAIIPAAGARWGVIELELIQADAGEMTLDFFTQVTGLFHETAPTRHAFRVDVFDHHSPSAAYPATAPGRIPWIRYQLDDVGGSIVFAENILSGRSSSVGFETGDLKMSLFPGDGIDWLTVDGSRVPSRHSALINRLRLARNNPANYSFTSDEAAGFIRLRFDADPVLDGLHVHGSPAASSVEILNASGGVSNGIFRLDGLDHAPGDKKAIIGEAFNNAGAGEAVFRPFAIPDSLGGGAKLPPADFVRFMAPSDLPNGDPRLVLTFQEWAIGPHVHPWSFGGWFTSQGVNENPSYSGLAGHSHAYNHSFGDGVFPFGGGTGHGASAGIQTAGPSGYNHYHNTYVAASGDTGTPGNTNNSTENRPSNFGAYLLIKT